MSVKNEKENEKLYIRITPSDVILFGKPIGLGHDDSVFRNVESFDSIPMVFSGMIKGCIVQSLADKYHCKPNELNTKVNKDEEELLKKIGFLKSSSKQQLPFKINAIIFEQGSVQDPNNTDLFIKTPKMIKKEKNKASIDIQIADFKKFNTIKKYGSLYAMTSDAWITLDSRPLYESNLKTLESRKKDLPFLNTKDLDFKLNQSNFENSENIKLYSFETRVGIKIDESGTVTEETGLYFVDFLKLQKNTYWFLEVEADAEIIDILKSFPFAQLGSLNHTVSIKILDKHHHPFSSLIDWQKKELKEIEEDLNKNNPSIIALCFIQKTVIHYEYTPPVDGIKELDWTGKIDRLTQLLFQRPADVSMEYLGDIYTEKVLYGHYNQALHKLTHEYLTLEGYTIFFKISTKENNFFNFSGTLFSYSENDFFTSENGFGQFIIKKIDQL